MEKETREVKEIRLEELIPFSLYPAQIYQGERLEQLMGSIERVGLMNPIIVRPVVDGKYEIICGHNRAKAMEVMGSNVIWAEVRSGLSDEEAIELFFDSNLNQQSFSDWSYSQKFEAVKYIEEQIRKNSKQGERTDLEKKKAVGKEDGTCVQSRQKLDGGSKRATIRDKMACRLGISAATFSKYRSIVKLPDDVVESIARLLDQKKITFEAAYRISGLRSYEVRMLVCYIARSQNKKIDMDKLKELRDRSKGEGLVSMLSKAELKAVLISK